MLAGELKQYLEAHMLDGNFHTFKKRLLQCGVNPKYVNRTVNELQDHYVDLKRDAIASGLSDADAKIEALSSIGEEEVIIREVMSKPELKSLAYRFPWAVYGVGSVATLVISVMIVLFMLVTLGNFLGPEYGLAWPVVTWYQSFCNCAGFFIMYGLTPLLLSGIVISALNREAPPFWPALGCVLVAMVGSGINIYAVWPQSYNEIGSLSLHWGFQILDNHSHEGTFPNTLRLATNITLAYFIYYKGSRTGISTSGILE